MTDNVIQLPLRRKARPATARQTLAEQLRATARLPKDDRPIMASNLGKMVASLNRANLIDAAKSIFDIAWPGDSTKWAKRKRLLRFEGEQIRDPQDYGSYEAAGAPYLLITNAIAKISLPPGAEENLKSEQERRVAQLLWGTSFRPRGSSVDETTADARSLMVQVASAVKAQVRSTGVQKLWETLQTSPFRPIDVEFAISNRKFGHALIPIKGDNGEVLDFHNAQEFGLFYSQYIGWSRPKVFLGWLLRRLTVDLLLPPLEIRLHSDEDENLDNPNLKKLEAWSEEWADRASNGTKTLPDHYFDKDLGHGWTEAEFDVVYGVYACATPDQDNDVKISLIFEGGADGGCETLMLPSGYVNELTHQNDLFGYLEDEKNDWNRTCTDSGVFVGFYKHYIPESVHGNFYWWSGDASSGERFILSDRVRPGELLGVVSFPDGFDSPDPPGEILLSEIVDGEAAEILIGNDKTHFVSVVPEAAGAPVPCRADSLAASLLRNSILESEEDRLSSLLADEAEGLTERGLQFYNAVIDLYRRSIK